MTTPGSYASGGGVPAASDTTSPDTTAAPSFASFDELSEFGVSPSIAKIPVPWTSKVVTQGDISALSPWGEDQVGQTVVDSTVSYEEATKALYGFQPGKLANLQDLMAAGGFYGKNPDFIRGSPDVKYTAPIWQNIVKQAMREKKTPDQIIQEAVDANGGLEAGLAKHPPGGAGTLPPTVTLSHPDDIRMMAKQISVKTLGKGWDNKQLDAFVKTYQAMQQSESEATHQTRVAAPSLQGAVEAEARRQNPVAAQATDADTAMQMMRQSFKTLGG